MCICRLKKTFHSKDCLNCLSTEPCRYRSYHCIGKWWLSHWQGEFKVEPMSLSKFMHAGSSHVFLSGPCEPGLFTCRSQLESRSMLSGNLSKWKKQLSHDVITDIHSKLRETLSNHCGLKLRGFAQLWKLLSPKHRFHTKIVHSSYRHLQSSVPIVISGQVNIQSVA